MANIIVAFSKPEDAKSIKNILLRNGFPVIAVCTSGAQVLSQLDDLNSGIIVCGYRLTDMLYSELHDCMSLEFSMLMISSPSKWSAGTPEQVVCLPMPLKVHDLVGTLEMIVQAQERRRKKLRQQPKQRDEKERAIINQAKALLMERNNMTEEEAHRYIQKCSMDSGTNMLETAQMVISLM
ncbi:ANTAR domain-containing protein [Clostridium sp. OF09-36]|uniref:ANTAR domain-containing response regulator n=1 Tax=Clostridium sp. OF09-36 TaxID=2292310 RepID=UPI000E4B4707|nr:ANTAR domain-containing protein [Clostridium sp. OF09-36]RHV86409.1 ANTAR domain-containing protein [Clostridium sp. OF09-36]